MSEIALVTGASEGLGFACAQGLLRAGHRVCIMSRHADKLTAAVKALQTDHKDNIQAVTGNLAEPESLERAITQIRGLWGDVSILINSNGGPPAGKVTNLTDEEWTLAYQTYALPVFRAIRMVVPAMTAAKWGRIITISSIAAREPIPNLDLSNFFRGGFATLHKSMARDLAVHGINVHTILPGAIETERTHQRIRARAQELNITLEKSREISEQKIPKGILGKPSAVGELAAFLCSEAADYLTGCAIPVDGGMSTSV